mmetsp:Transcript_5844/g.16965  ORF Transcript_5844/g.16965 Transcript_5844/m.16965 type:complete len:309 (-) Transcript_5844:54-980(-)
MASKIFANVGAAVSAAISVLWIICITCPGRWISSVSLILDFQASLLVVHSSAGTATTGALMVSRLFTSKETWKAVKGFINKDQWWEDAMHEFCSQVLEFHFGWCTTWTLAAYASWAMLALGFMTAVAFMIGSGFMYYYANVKATKTGRVSCKTCFIVAPVLATVGLLQYTLLTLDFGHDKLNASVGFHAISMFGPSYVFACCLLVFSFIPVYSMSVFFRADPLEKEHADSDSDDAQYFSQKANGQAYGGYGAAAGMLQPQSSQFAYSNAQQGQQQYAGQPQSWGPNWNQPASGDGRWGASPGFGQAAW